MQPPQFSGTDAFAPTPWVPPTVNGGTAADATNDILSKLYPTQQQTQQAPAQQAAPKPSGNFLTRLFPALGGLGGGAAGSALGSLILPGIGTAIGGILGAGLGSGGAKAGENAVEGQNVGNDVLREGISGAGGQAFGGILGKVATGALGLLGKGAGNIIAKNAAARSEAEAANSLAQGFPESALTPKVKTNLNFGRSLDLAQKMGVPQTPEGFMTASQAGTGANGFLNGTLDNIVRNSGNVDLGSFNDIVDKALTAHPELGPLVAAKGAGVPGTAATAKNFLRSLTQDTGLGGEGGNLTTGLSPGGYPSAKIGLMSATPDQALDLLRSIGKLPGSTKDPALSAAYKDVYGNLKQTIYNRPEVNSAIQGMNVSPEDVASLSKATGGNQQLTDFLSGVVNNAQNASDILTPQSHLIDMGKAGRMAQDYLDNVVGTSAGAKAANAAAQSTMQPIHDTTGAILNHLGAAGGVMGAGLTGNPMMLAAAVPALLKSEPAKQVGGAILGKLADGGVTQGAAKVIAPALLGTSQLLAHAPNYVPGAAPNPSGENTMLPQAGGQQAPIGTGQSPNEQMLRMALVGLQNPLYAQSFAPLVNELLTGPIQKANSANAALTSAEGAFNQAGGGQGLIGGLLGKLGGALTGGAASTYGDQRSQLINQLTALGLPTSAVPDITNTSGAANTEFQTLQNLINSVAGGGGGQGLLAGIH